MNDTIHTAQTNLVRHIFWPILQLRFPDIVASELKSLENDILVHPATELNIINKRLPREYAQAMKMLDNTIAEIKATCLLPDERDACDD